MLPTLRPDDRLLVRYAAPVAAGRLVLARFPDGALVVKPREAVGLCVTVRLPAAPAPITN